MLLPRLFHSEQALFPIVLSGILCTPSLASHDKISGFSSPSSARNNSDDGSRRLQYSSFVPDFAFDLRSESHNIRRMPPENVPSPKQSFPETAWSPKILKTHPVFLPPAAVLPHDRGFHFGNKIREIPDHILKSPLHIHTLHSAP